MNFCTLCFAHIQNKNFNTNYSNCLSLDGVSNVSYPKEGSKLRFNAHYATEMAPLICIFDTESILKKSTKKNTLNKHEICAYEYLILDKEGKIVKSRADSITNTSQNLADEMLRNMEADFENCMKNIEASWCHTAFLTKKDEENFQNTNKCEISMSDFISSKDKLRHHRWDVHTVYEHNKLIKGN